MSPLEMAKEWLSNEKPTTEEIQQSVDNLCHQVARPPAGVTTEQLQGAIAHLMRAIGKDPSEVVLPEAPSVAALDTGPLGTSADEAQPRLEGIERRKMFDQLKRNLQAPF